MTANRQYSETVLSNLPRPPLSIVDATGRAIEIRLSDTEERDDLVKMYLNWEPTSYTPGVPPRQEDRIQSWLDHLLASGFDTIAFHDEVVVGHASLVCSGERSYEAAVFVKKPYQRAGIGSLLGEATLGHAQAAGVERVWLRYERGNRAATALLRPYLEDGLKNYVGDHSQVEITFRLNRGDSRSSTDQDKCENNQKDTPSACRLR
jgi:GNAT superfamily N-acetyltransferase